ncbi:MAG: transglutaminase-like domain-containing protein [Candidatus Promineifilaceae bacterium]|nr:transglutaminase-like domain-containing protein [Candidatus Promineifilaceae bacterium]
MLEYLFTTIQRRRSAEDSYSFLLLLVLIWVMIVAVLAVGWVDEDWIIIPSALLGLIMGSVLARRPLRPWIAWTLISLYGLLIITLSLARLWPPLTLLLTDWRALRQYWLQNGAVFLDRAGSWFTAVSVGGRSNETITFAYLMGLLAWFLSAYVAWSVYRQRRPLLGLILMGLLIAVNGYYGQAPLEWAVAFVGMAVVTTAVLHFANLEYSWQRNQVDYSREIRLEMFAYAAGIGAALLAFAYFIPAISPSKLALALLNQPAVSGIEDSLDRAFGGVDPPRRRQPAPGQSGGAGIMPRSFLLGNPPELEKIVMMTATTEILQQPAGATIDLARHWRGLSYEIYTGQGWSLSDERIENFAAGEELPLPLIREPLIIRQDVQWRYDNRVIRYSLGLPLSFDHDTTAAFRDQNDFVRARASSGHQYEVISRVSAAAAEDLRSSPLSAVPPQIKNRYTQLPANLPQRIRDLAQDVAGDEPTPYDQARAIERFLRQYEYSLDVPMPPEEVDPVDFFLFDLQAGYCDYYASSMVVMARSLGLPARLATGFLAQAADENDVQTVRQIDAHSWAEVYFPGYGWVEFEPTAPFISPHDPQFAANSLGTAADQEPDPPEDTPPIPAREPQQPVPWSRLVWIALLVIFAGAAVFWWSRQPKIANEIDRAYYRLQKNASHLGHPLIPSQTPAEFSADFLYRLESFNERPRLARMVDALKTPLNRLTDLVNRRQYSDHPPDSKTADFLWKRMRRPLWLLRLARRLKL